MQDRRLKTLATLLKYAAGIAAAGYIAMYVVVAMIRISYPFELEWIEGLTVDHVQRILDGQPFYAAPSVEFVSSLYTPLYYYVSAGAAQILGVGFLPLRLVSILASLGCMGLLYSLVRRETKDRYAGLIAAGLFAATFRLAGAFFDLARVDSLFLFFLLAAVWVLRFYRTRAGFVIAGLLTTLSFLTKQTALLAAVFFLIYAGRYRKQGGWYFTGAFLLSAGLAVVLLDILSDGWFKYYVFEVPVGHPIMKFQLVKFWAQDILRPLPLASLMGLLYLTARWLKGAADDVWFYLLTGMGFLAAAGAPRIKDGNYDNDLIPAYAFIALLCGIAIPALRAWGKELLETVPASYPNRRRVISCLSCFFILPILIQLATLFYGPQNQIPTAKDRAAGNLLIQHIREIPGEVWVGCHGYLPVLAGKRSYATAMPIYDVLAAQNEHVKGQLMESINRALAERRFSAIITDGDEFLDMDRRTDYECQRLSYAGKDDFWPVTGYQTRPSMIYVPKPR